MASPQKFLIVDDNPDSRYLLVKTLLRKFPLAAIQECQSAETASQVFRAEKPLAAVVHRAGEVDGLTMIRTLRATDASTPIVMVSGFDRSKEAVAAGATSFLPYDEWLRIGTVVAEILKAAQARPTDSTPPSGPAA